MTALQPMTFLQLARRLRQEGRGTGNAGPTTVVNQEGDAKDWVDWTAESWNRIQGAKRSWRWMYGTASVNVAAGERDFPLATILPVADDLARFANWKPNSFKYRTVAEGLAGERNLAQGSFENEMMSDFGTPSEANRPNRVSVMTDNSLRIRPTVTEAGVLTGRYYKGPQGLYLDDDVPEMPARFHMLIVWDALVDHAVGEVSQEQYERAVMRRTELWYALLADQLETPSLYSQTMVE